ncbi:hypothetical protein [Flavihumibacter fluvii]|uniref:hypothetical protein n=1 Tax=Flavihumibacter fluvii TaxID=2838157 RepID=UPI001BDEA6CF|nr:hypothetical protein [Flavihumibacter fluvii]ULQ50884.1 hypothetical protein KJS93_12395 [Flavihumibacter fluvii]
MAVPIRIGCIFLDLVKNTEGRLAKIFILYGKVPKFFYILHFYLIGILSTSLFFARGHSFADG